MSVSRVSNLQDTGKSDPHQALQHAEQVKAAADAESAEKNVKAEAAAGNAEETITNPESAQKPVKKTRTRKTKSSKQQEAPKKAETAGQTGTSDRAQAEEQAEQAGQPETVKQTDRAADPAASGKGAAQSIESPADDHQEPTLSQRKNDLNNRVLQVLSKAKFDNKTAGQAASLVAGFCGRENAKRDIYTAIVKLFGQKKGLEIYRCIKGTI